MKNQIPLLGFILLALPSFAKAQDFYDESILREVRLDFQQNNWWSILESNYGTNTEIPATMTVDGVTYADVGVRFKGNTSYTRPITQKKSFNISTNSFVPDQDLMGYSTLNFNNAFMDPTFMREVLFSKVCRSYTTAARGNFIHLIINNENWGVYANVQQLNKDFLDQWYPTDTGDRFKIPSAMRYPGKASLNWLGSNPTSYQQWYELKSEDPLAYDRLVLLCDTLNNTPPGSGYVQTVEDTLALDRALWTLALENAFMDSDGYVHKGSDYAIYRDIVHGRWNLLQRDANEAFGSFGMNSWGTNGGVNLHPDYETNNPDLPLLNRLLTIPVVRERYLAHFRTILEEWVDWGRVGPIVTAWDNLIRTEVQADTKKIYSFADYTTNLYSDVIQGHTVFKGLQQYVDERQAYLLSLPEFSRPQPQLAKLAHYPPLPAEGQTVVVTVEASAPQGSNLADVTLRYREVGAFQEMPMFDDGQHGDGAPGDGVYGAQVPGSLAGAKIEYYVSSSCDSSSGGAWSFLPRTAEFQPPSWSTQTNSGTSPCLNEFLAKNSTTNPDPSGDFDDWVEILNRNNSPINLDGVFLSDDPTNLSKWPFPAGTILQPGETILVWCDEDASQGSLHANFKLSGSGEEIFLVDVDGVTILDSITYGPQSDDISTGRLFDGNSLWATFIAPTPGVSNEQSCGFREFDQFDPSAHGLHLEGIGSPAYGGALNIKISGAASGDFVTIYASTSPDYIDAYSAAGVVLINPNQIVFQRRLSANGNGEASMSTQLNNAALIGRRFFAQAHALSSSLGEQVSNGLEVIICP
ncbi:MAG: CotH kinase family protein [Planctomycetota bacterium]|nr:CotH kinase family protein [Planctomycetota bacterium]